MHQSRIKTELDELEHLLNNKSYTCDAISSLMPGLFYITSLKEIPFKFTNGINEKKIRTFCDTILNKILLKINQFERVASQPWIQEMQEEDDSIVILIFQKIQLKNKVNRWVLINLRFFKNNYTLSSVLQLLTDENESTQILIKLLDENLKLKSYANNLSNLTKREKQILQLVANGSSTKEISENLFISAFTVSTHRKNIIQKLQIKSPTGWKKYADILEQLGNEKIQNGS